MTQYKTIALISDRVSPVKPMLMNASALLVQISVVKTVPPVPTLQAVIVVDVLKIGLVFIAQNNTMTVLRHRMKPFVVMELALTNKEVLQGFLTIDVFVNRDGLQ